MKSIWFAALLGISIFILPAVSGSENTIDLKSIMQGLRDNVVEISDGLLTDDYEKVARGAGGVADHPTIPAEQVQLVANALGAEMPAFKQYDTMVHNRSLELAAAAKAQNREAAVTAYLAMVEGCLACHQQYKQRVATALGSTLQ